MTALPCIAQFDSGSDGSMGVLDVQANTTLDVPEDGRFHFTTVNIASSRVLRFNRNANNTPIYLLATGPITIAGDIEVSGQQGTTVSGGLSGSGGFDGGNPGSVSTPPGDGLGPGAGRAGTQTFDEDGAGSGGYSTVSTTGSSTRHGGTYGGALIIPPIGGSGGGGSEGTPGSGGGGGGGAIVVASNESITFLSSSAEIYANGGSSRGNSSNAGSGGAIRLVAPKISGNGRLLALGGNGGGGHGRIRVDLIDRSELNLNFLPDGSTSVGSLMLVDPEPLPRLDIVHVAGGDIPVGSGPVTRLLSFGSNPEQPVTVQATGFGSIVPITVVLTPDNGPAASFEGQIDNTTQNPASTTITATFPVNVQTTVHVWTR